MDHGSNRCPGSPGTRRDVPEGPIHSRVWKMVDVELGRISQEMFSTSGQKGPERWNGFRASRPVQKEIRNSDLGSRCGHTGSVWSAASSLHTIHERLPHHLCIRPLSIPTQLHTLLCPSSRAISLRSYDPPYRRLDRPRVSPTKVSRTASAE